MSKKPRKISLPTYPFSRERYWVDGIVGGALAANKRQNRQAIHPLVHENTSSFGEQRFTSVFSGDEFFLADHRVLGNKVMPGAVYLEMVRVAVEKATEAVPGESMGLRFRNVAWVRPVTVGEQGTTIHIALSLDEAGTINFEVRSQTGAAEAILHSQGQVELDTSNSDASLNLSELVSKKWDNGADAEKFYGLFRNLGIEYGERMQSIELLSISGTESLAKIVLPQSPNGEADKYAMHPAMLDGAFQSVIGLLADNNSGKPALPFAIDGVEFRGPCESTMWALSKFTVPGQREKIDIRLVNGQGKVCVEVKGLAFRPLEGSAGLGTADRRAHSPTAKEGVVLFEPEWREIGLGPAAPAGGTAVIFMCEFPADQFSQVAQGLPDVRLVNLSPEGDNQGFAERYEAYSKKIILEIQGIMKGRPENTTPVLLAVPGTADGGLFAGLGAVLKTAQIENPLLVGRTIELEGSIRDVDLVACLKSESTAREGSHIRYLGGKRLVFGLRDIEYQVINGLAPWKDSGVYLITGGIGGLGKIVATDIVAKVDSPVVVLTGRSQLDPGQKTWVDVLSQTGARVLYRSVDVTQATQVDELIAELVGSFGKIDGIIHSAGVIRDNFILRKAEPEIAAVLGPKLRGTINLDRATSEIGLDFFALFSSTSGLLGNSGQADYAAANAFMDAFAHRRNLEREAGLRRGLTISLNWPLWKDGGMKVEDTDGQMQRQLAERGIDLLRAETGLAVLYEGLKSGKSQIMAMAGDIRRIKAMLMPSQAPEPAVDPVPGSAPAVNSGAGELRVKTQAYLAGLISKVTKIAPEKIRPDIPFERFGIDSIMIMQLTADMERDFGSVSKTLFFEYQDLSGLSEYFLRHFGARLSQLLGVVESESHTMPNWEPSRPNPVPAIRPAKLSNRFLSAQGQVAKPGMAADIAIIGLDGRYPGAKDIGHFWKNLRHGKDCVTEVPEDRWDWRKYFDPDKNKQGKTYSKWGGFIEGVYAFDPQFFNILPSEAVSMDPQERKFLECVYRTIEDAGYTSKSLKANTEIGGANVGVYVGVMYDEHQLFGAEEQAHGRNIALSGFSSSIANRVSYVFNFVGPSLALNTMCSSSLTAIHLACQSLSNGDCDAAIAGGVNVSIHPNKYLLLSQGKFVSSKGRCESFGNGGDGYVPGEGVGAVLLKPLAKAMADGDHIYGVIKSSVLNAGGKTTGYTVPSPVMQAELIRRAIKKAGVNARDIGYIEAHGTGTFLGDPIEIEGLTRAFRDHTGDNQFCAIGSVKSNIGHCESAAGIAAVSKVLLQLKHRQLVPSLHSGELNSNIDFGQTPFTVQRELADWEGPGPRIAGVSAFGAGGANAHLIIEEYVERRIAPESARIDNGNPALIILSARDAAGLEARAKGLLHLLDKEKLNDSSLASIAYTLQVGREEMAERLGFTAASLGELQEKLKDFLKNPEGAAYRGSGKRRGDAMADLAQDEEMAETIAKWLAKKKFGKLLELWVSGMAVDWAKLYTGNRPLRLSLPAYTFSEEVFCVKGRPESHKILPMANMPAETKHPKHEMKKKTSGENPFELE